MDGIRHAFARFLQDDSGVGPTVSVFLGALILFVLYTELVIKPKRRRRIRRLAELPCPHCGTRFGKTESTRARTTFTRRFRNLRRAYRGRTRDIPRKWPVQCPMCDRESYFEFATGNLTTIF